MVQEGAGNETKVVRVNLQRKVDAAPVQALSGDPDNHRQAAILKQAEVIKEYREIFHLLDTN